MVEDCQQQRPAMRLRTVFMITGIGVHDPPESGVHDQTGIRVHDPRNPHQLHLIAQQRSWSHINQVVCALRFFYGITLGRSDANEQIVAAREPPRLPGGLSATLDHAAHCLA